MARLEVSRDEVLAWMAASGCGPAEAARHFGVPSGTIKAWSFKARRATGATAQPQPRNHTTTPVIHLAPPVKHEVPPEVLDDLREGMALRAKRMRTLDEKAESSMESARILVLLAEKVDMVGDAVEGKTKPDTTTADPAEVRTQIERWASSMGLRLVPEGTEAGPVPADGYDATTAGGTA